MNPEVNYRLYAVMMSQNRFISCNKWTTLAADVDNEGGDTCMAAAAKSLQSCLTLCDPIDGRPPGSAVPRILQARTLEWVAISFSNARKWKVKVRSLSCVRLFVTPWTTAYQAPPSMGFSRQEYWSGLPLPSPIHVWGQRVYDKSLYIPFNLVNLKLKKS